MVSESTLQKALMRYLTSLHGLSIEKSKDSDGSIVRVERCVH